MLPSEHNRAASRVARITIVWQNLADGADDHTTEVRCSPDVRRWPHDGFTMAKMYSRTQHEIEPYDVVLPSEHNRAASRVARIAIVWQNLADGADDHTTEVRCSPDVRRWPHDGFTMAKMYSRTQHEIEPSCVLPVFFFFFFFFFFFGMSKILMPLAMVLPKA